MGISTWWACAGGCVEMNSGKPLTALGCVTFLCPGLVAGATGICLKENPECKEKELSADTLYEAMKLREKSLEENTVLGFQTEKIMKDIIMANKKFNDKEEGTYYI